MALWDTACEAQWGPKWAANPDHYGHTDQEAEIEILFVKHTLLAVAKAAVLWVKLGAKEIEGLKMSMGADVGD